jgi:hypothetical protein
MRGAPGLALEPGALREPSTQWPLPRVILEVRPAAPRDNPDPLTEVLASHCHKRLDGDDFARRLQLLLAKGFEQT